MTEFSESNRPGALKEEVAETSTQSESQSPMDLISMTSTLFTFKVEYRQCVENLLQNLPRILEEYIVLHGRRMAKETHREAREIFTNQKKAIEKKWDEAIDQYNTIGRKWAKRLLDIKIQLERGKENSELLNAISKAFSIVQFAPNPAGTLPNRRDVLALNQYLEMIREN